MHNPSTKIIQVHLSNHWHPIRACPWLLPLKNKNGEGEKGEETIPPAGATCSRGGRRQQQIGESCKKTADRGGSDQQQVTEKIGL
jgi:hypothetical protein